MNDGDDDWEAMEKAARLRQEEHESRTREAFEDIRAASKAEREERWRKQAREAVARSVRRARD